MFQTIEGHEVYVVDLTPKLPKLRTFTEPWLGFTRIVSRYVYADRYALRPLAEALNDALKKQIIKEPGKYAIELYGEDGKKDNYFIYRVDE